ncbi:serine carboxypeptidase-like 47 [Salvia miltiorrhiza]|uniref:serine carboxypeptidase-like 47 n=1 Tax=Salvia miltiorrhiza TaxID=226208 RepID=UPI0025AD975B|nr:serine carboxypeptidase-like 47 [Salvia miltiorrhiza]
MKLINRVQYYRLARSEKTCEIKTRACGANSWSSICEEAYRICTGIFHRIVVSKPGLNYYDIRKNCTGSLCYDFSNVETFLNDKAVQKALGVRDIYFVPCSSKVYELMFPDMMKNFQVGLPTLLQDGIKLLIYAGEYDLICNWLGNSRWVENMQWSGRKRFVSGKWVPFKVGGVAAGLRKSYGGLTFLKVYNAGHMVPMDQPRASLEMLRKWMQGLFDY